MVATRRVAHRSAAKVVFQRSVIALNGSRSHPASAGSSLATAKVVLPIAPTPSGSPPTTHSTWYPCVRTTQGKEPGEATTNQSEAERTKGRECRARHDE
jgi:hypothetical protein